ncbi:hypothetical protein [Shinella granuli]|uniref:Uncharacterized protein n=1 Tax=Shinella granuli TaxID=323621 RepID=A0A4R2C3J6_SHIGR|nr:hypothetical protein [Shinella granuli]TCN32974.1 hypothetical protein EV665_14317 [Shinella granuli]
MTKEEQFLWIVQTAILANGINLASDPDRRVAYKDTYSSTGVRIVMREAVRAATLIPKDMDVGDAADDFCLWMFRNHQEALLAEDHTTRVPYWFAR